MVREDKARTASLVDAETRLNDARAYLQQAEISLELVRGPRVAATVVSSAVLAGVAAADAACAMALGRFSTGAHDQAARLLGTVNGSKKAVGDLSRLVAIRTAAQSAGDSITDRQAMDAIDRARRLLAFAEAQRRI